MWIYFLKRLFRMIPVMLIVTFLVYALMLAIPGDPARALIGRASRWMRNNLTTSERNTTWINQLLSIWNMARKALQGDLGRQLEQRPIADELKSGP